MLETLILARANQIHGGLEWNRTTNGQKKLLISSNYKNRLIVFNVCVNYSISKSRQELSARNNLKIKLQIVAVDSNLARASQIHGGFEQNRTTDAKQRRNAKQRKSF